MEHLQLSDNIPPDQNPASSARLGVPAEIWFSIFSYLSRHDIESFSLCSQHNRKLSLGPLFQAILLSPESLAAFQTGSLQGVGSRVQHVTFTGFRSGILADKIAHARLYTSPSALATFPNLRSIKIPFFTANSMRMNFVILFMNELVRLHDNKGILGKLQNLQIDHLKKAQAETMPPQPVPTQSDDTSTGENSEDSEYPTLHDDSILDLLWDTSVRPSLLRTFPASLIELSVNIGQFSFREHKYTVSLGYDTSDDEDPESDSDSDSGDEEFAAKYGLDISYKLTPNPYLLHHSAGTLKKLTLTTSMLMDSRRSEKLKTIYPNLKELHVNMTTPARNSSLFLDIVERFPNLEILTMLVPWLYTDTDPYVDIALLSKIRKVRLSWPRPVEGPVYEDEISLWRTVSYWLESGTENLKEVAFVKPDKTYLGEAGRVRVCRISGGRELWHMKWSEEGWISPNLDELDLPDGPPWHQVQHL
ncbi:hypothetical protein AA313_de0204375 [Arthrobotrys entomopaga]|nr:hypothetical protein AA313_de0204375 [Arthrobotrys entomopaga]